MREVVAVLAILGALIELLGAIGGPQLAGVGLVSGEDAPAMATGPLLLGLAIGVTTIVGGARVAMGGNGQRWGAILVLGSVAGAMILTPWTLWFTFGAAIALIGGVLALFIRRPRKAGWRPHDPH
jgi:hypothetical protein